MSIPEKRIELPDLVLRCQNKEGSLYEVERKTITESVGTVEIFSELSNNSYKISSIIFNLKVHEKDVEIGVDLAFYCIEIIWGFTSSAFETLDIESVSICFDLFDELIEKMVEYGFEKNNGEFFLTRSSWGGDNGELVSLALFDILGFSNLVLNRNNVAMKLYRKLVNIINNNHDEIFSLKPLGPPWTSGAYVLDNIGNIHISYFSDSFLIWTDYRDIGYASWTGSGINIDDNDFPLSFGEPNTLYYPRFMEKHEKYLKFIDVCREFFCQSIISGIPLRGCIATGLAKMDINRSLFVGSPLIEVAKGELEQNSIGVAFGKSFNNYHPVWNRYHIPYSKHKKTPNEPNSNLSPMLVDYPRYWREKYPERDFIQLVTQMNTDPSFSHYYDNAIDFYKFSKENKEWYANIKKGQINNILDFYDRINCWLATV